MALDRRTQIAFLPSEFDVDLTDVTDDILKIVADDLGLDPEWRKKRIHEFERITFPVKGIIYGPNSRIFIPLALETVKAVKKQESRQDIFVFVTSSPYTFLTHDLLSALGLFEPDSDMTNGTEVDIQGHLLSVHPSHGHFSHVNILGMDYMTSIEYMQMRMDYSGNTVHMGPNLLRYIDDCTGDEFECDVVPHRCPGC